MHFHWFDFVLQWKANGNKFCTIWQQVIVCVRMCCSFTTYRPMSPIWIPSNNHWYGFMCHCHIIFDFMHCVLCLVCGAMNQTTVFVFETPVAFWKMPNWSQCDSSQNPQTIPRRPYLYRSKLIECQFHSVSIRPQPGNSSIESKT